MALNTEPGRPGDYRARPRLRAFLLFANFFLIILAYYLVKPASRSLFLDHADAVHLPYVWTASALLLLLCMPVYQWILRHVARVRVVIGSCLLIAILLVTFRFWMAWYPGLALAVGFYILVDVFSVVLVEQFWSLTNSIHQREEGSRWYGLIASGGLLGGLAGGLIAGWLIRATPLTTVDLLVVAAGVILFMTVQTAWLARHGMYREDSAHQRAEAVRQAMQKGWRALRTNRFLWFIALMLFFSQVAEPIVEYQFMTLVEQEHSERESRTAYLSHFFSLLSACALLVNLLITPLVHRHLGAIAGLLVQPVLLGISAVVFAFNARLTVAATMKIADRGMSYSINRASRELLYIPIDPVTIYQAKAWIDMVGYRSFKIAGNVVILLLTQWLPWRLGHVDLAWVVVGICAFWIAAILHIRGQYASLSRESEAARLPAELQVMPGREA